jgi:hypothetical protein
MHAQSAQSSGRLIESPDRLWRWEAELRSQILGQLSEGINYQKLYAEALRDPKLKRTEVELQAAMQNASDAREAVFELFQDLDGFSLDEYEPLSNTSKDVEVVAEFVKGASELDGMTPVALGPGDFRLENEHGEIVMAFTPNRDQAKDSKTFELLGLDHPHVAKHMRALANEPADEIGIRVQSRGGRSGYLGVWKIETEGERRQRKTRLVTIGVSKDGERVPSWERKPAEVFQADPVEGSSNGQIAFYKEVVEPIFERELKHRGIVTEGISYQADLVGWVEVV